MALLCCCDSYLVVAASSNVFIVDRKSTLAKISTSSNSEPIILSAVISSDTLSSEKKTRDEGADASQSEMASNSPQVLAVGFSNSGRLLAICNNRKQLIVYRQNEKEWIQEKYWILEKQATALTITADDKSIVVADRYGQVTKYDSDSASGSTGNVLLGHVSMLLDLCLSKSEHFLLTADRDEKIRVSHFPKSYDIQSFCLGHTDYVRTLCLCPGLNQQDDQEDVLVSGGGDGLLKMWRYVDGVELASFDFGSDSVDDDSRRKRIRKILCLQGEKAKSDTADFRLVVLFDVTPQLQFLNVIRSTDGGYSISKVTDWKPDQEGEIGIADVVASGGRLFVLLSRIADAILVEVDLASETPVRLVDSPISIALSNCDQFSQCLSKAKEELPPIEKTVQFDNVGEYLERKRVRIEGRSKASGDL